MTVKSRPATGHPPEPSLIDPHLGRYELESTLRAAGLTLAAASRRIGRNHAYLQQYVRRGSPRQLSERDRQMLMRMLGRPAGDAPGSPARLAVDHAAAPMVRIACPWSAPGVGYSGFMLDAGIASRLSGGRADCLAAMLADSDAMAPTIRSGDQLLIDTSQCLAERDGLYALPGETAPLIRRISMDPITRRLNILADNSAYPSQYDHDRRSLTIIGRVIWIGRTL